MKPIFRSPINTMECHRSKAKLNVTAGLGGMGGAQPLAITMNEGVALVAEVEEWRIQKRIETKYLDVYYTDIDEAIDRSSKSESRRRSPVGGCFVQCGGFAYSDY
jgi:urocanate hydratase